MNPSQRLLNPVQTLDICAALKENFRTPGPVIASFVYIHIRKWKLYAAYSALSQTDSGKSMGSFQLPAISIYSLVFPQLPTRLPDLTLGGIFVWLGTRLFK